MKNKNKNYWWAILLVTLVGAGVIKVAEMGAYTEQRLYKQPKLEFVKELPEEEKTNAEHIWTILTEEYNLTLEEKIEALSIVKCESNFDSWAIGVNSGSLDLGIWQTNTKYQDISRECAFDLYCQTRWIMDNIYLKQGNWNAWTCSRKLGIN